MSPSVYQAINNDTDQSECN